VLVAQSRIMTEQGGSILMWSSNGNLDPGEGAKTSVSAPPPKSSCDVDHRCGADIKGDPGALEFQQQSGLSHHRRGHRPRRQRRGSESVAAGSPKQERRQRSEQQDSNSAVQVLGAGNLSAQASNI
jgi:hypothetical protein